MQQYKEWRIFIKKKKKNLSCSSGTGVPDEETKGHP